VSFAIVSLIILVVIALIAIPILIRVFGEAAGRNPNRPSGPGSDRSGEENQNERSGQGRE
jgi:flagellar basal body-associated protein FliL